MATSGIGYAEAQEVFLAGAAQVEVFLAGAEKSGVGKLAQEVFVAGAEEHEVESGAHN